jgi:predicted transposase YbfD/YdcC
MLAQLTDPRDPRGVRHPLVVVLAIAVIATLAGAKNYRELGDQASDLPQDLLWLLGARYCPRRHCYLAPSGSTLYRVLVDLDAGELDIRVGAWLREYAAGCPAEWVLALDGKVLRGSWNAEGDLTLFSAMLHQAGTVLGQVRVPAGTNEITQVKPLLEAMDLQDALITTDAAHTQVETARYLVEDKKADYLMPLKGNQPTLHTGALNAVRPLVVGSRPHHVRQERGHGRINRWSTWVTPDVTEIDLPGAAQLACIRRDVLALDGQAVSKEFAIMVTSRGADRLDAAGIERHTRGHWGIENLEHRCRDVTWGEDDHQAYTGSGPHAMAILRNLALSLLRRAGVKQITRTVQWIAREPMRALALIAT